MADSIKEVIVTLQKVEIRLIRTQDNIANEVHNIKKRLQK